mgnify:FL=1
MEKITSLQNNKIKETAKLKEKKYREQTNTYLVEGYHLVEEALKHGLLKEVYILDIDAIDIKNYQSVNIYIVTKEIIKKLSNVVTTQGIIGVVEKCKNYISKDFKKIIVLDNIQDPGNLGTIIRTSAALGMDAVILTSDTVDAYNDKVVRATQGALFKIPVIIEEKGKIINYLKNNDFDIVVSSLDAKRTLDEVIPTSVFAIIVGNEANGVSKEFLNNATTSVIIPMHNDVESLNVAVASSILMYYYLK